MSRDDHGEYVRVYLSIRDDPRFTAVYGDNDRLATWLRLLMEADAVWPAHAPIPRAIDEPALTALIAAGIIELLPLDHYRVHGLDAERERRSAVGRPGGIASGLARRSPNVRHAVERTIAEGSLNERRTKLNTQRNATQRLASSASARTGDDGSRDPTSTTTKRNGSDDPPIPLSELLPDAARAVGATPATDGKWPDDLP